MDALAPIPELPLPAPPRLARFRSDAALAERFAAGDEAAFAALYERHRASVLAVCIGVLGSRHDAEDAAQESFASLAVALRAAPPRELRPWLVRVARNAAIDVARRRRVRVTADAELDEQAAVASGSGGELEIVLAGLRELPEAQRTALLMRELAGHSYAEIGALLEVDEEAVRGLIARARIGLRNYREATELPCATARAVLAAEHDGRRRPQEVRRHLRTCPGCRAYRQSLRADARALRALVPVPAGGFAGGTAVAGGLAAKGAVLGTTVTQVTAACAVSVCAVGGIVLLAPHQVSRHRTASIHRPANGHALPRPAVTGGAPYTAGATVAHKDPATDAGSAVAAMVAHLRSGAEVSSPSSTGTGSSTSSTWQRHHGSHGDGSGDGGSGRRRGGDGGSAGGGSSGARSGSGDGASGSGSGSGDHVSVNGGDSSGGLSTGGSGPLGGSTDGQQPAGQGILGSQGGGGSAGSTTSAGTTTSGGGSMTSGAGGSWSTGTDASPSSPSSGSTWTGTSASTWTGTSGSTYGGTGPAPNGDS